MNGKTERMSAKDFQELKRTGRLTDKPRKYRNEPTFYDSPNVGPRNYDSKGEANRARELDLMQAAGEIWRWQPQVTISLGPVFRCRMDFLVFRHIRGTEYQYDIEAEDFKGHETARWREVVKHWRRFGPCPLVVIKKDGQETIWPEAKRDETDG